MKKPIQSIMTGFVAVALAIALAGCGSGAETGEPVPEEAQAQAPSPAPEAEAEPVDDSAKEYSVNTELLSYIGKTPEEVSLELGHYEEAKRFTEMVFRYGDFWFAFDGDTEYPAGPLSLISCPAADLVDGLDDKIAVSDLDGVLGVQGVYEANEDEGNEWYTGGYVTYEYDSFIIDLGCSPGMAVSDDATVLISEGISGSDGAGALAEIIPSPFDRLWEDHGSAEWYGTQPYRSLCFKGNGRVELITGNKHTKLGNYEVYEIYKGTFQVFLDKDGSVGYDRISFDLALESWIWEFPEGADDEISLSMKERHRLRSDYTIRESGGSICLELLSGQPLGLTNLGGDPVESYTFIPMQ